MTPNPSRETLSQCVITDNNVKKSSFNREYRRICVSGYGGMRDLNTESKHKYSGSDDRSITPISHYCRLGHITCSDYLAADFKYLFLVVPAFINIEINTQSGCQHRGSEVFGIVPGLLFRLTECVMFADIPIR